MSDERMKAITWAREAVSDPTTVFLDTETTGLDELAEIVDIAIIARDGSVLLDTLVRPKSEIPAEATKVHGISNSDVRSAPSWETLYDAVRSALAGRRVVIYNADYDTRVIDGVTSREGLPAIPFRRECAMLAFADFDGTLGRYGKAKWHKLDAAARSFNIPPGGHRALGDAETTRQVVLALAAASRHVPTSSNAISQHRAPVVVSSIPQQTTIEPPPYLAHPVRHDPDVAVLHQRIAVLEAQARRPSRWKGNLFSIAHVAGWIVIVPATIAAALAGLAIPVTFLLVIFGVAPWSSPFQWLVIALVLAVIRFGGAFLIALGNTDEPASVAWDALDLER